MKKEKVEGYYSIVHRQFATDRYQYGVTVVKATSKKDAFDKLNKFLETKSNGVYTSLPCESLDHISELEALN